MCSSELCEYQHHACVVVQVVVGIGVLDGLNDWVELAPLSLLIVMLMLVMRMRMSASWVLLMVMQ